MAGDATDTRLNLILHCFEGEECRLVLEPEGSIQNIRKDHPLRIEVAPQPGVGYIEVAYVKGGISITAGTGHETRVWDDAGNELDMWGKPASQ